MKMSNDQWNTKMKIIIIKLLKRIKKKPVSFRSFPRKKKKKKKKMVIFPFAAIPEILR